MNSFTRRPFSVSSLGSASAHGADTLVPFLTSFILRSIEVVTPGPMQTPPPREAQRISEFHSDDRQAVTDLIRKVHVPCRR